jgi:cystathionine beta-lyase
MEEFDLLLPREGTNAYKLEMRKKIFGNPDVIPLWVADMDFAVPQVVVDSVVQRANHPIYGYTIRNESFNDSICSWMLRRHQWRVETGWIEYGPGVLPSMVVSILAFTQPGDKIVIQTPVYPPFFSVVKDNQRELVFNPLIEANGSYSMDYDHFSSIAKDPATKMIIISNPHNPVGRAWRKEELEKLAAICLENNVLILSDEIHSDLLLFGNKHVPMASIHAEIAQNTVTFMAPSKTFNIAGFNTSYVIISNKRLMAGYRKGLIALHLFTGNLMGGVALEAAYQHGEPWLMKLIGYLEGNVNAVESFLMNNLPNIKLSPSEATYLLWLDFRKLGLDSDGLKDLLVHKAGVGLNDGASFGQEGHGFMRMNVASPRSVIIQAMQQIANACKALNQ